VEEDMMEMEKGDRGWVVMVDDAWLMKNGDGEG
jgi:hypothetical protein